MSLRFAVVHEANADFMTATELADRVLTESIEWLESDGLSGQREWVDKASGGRLLTWKDIKKLAYEAGVRSHGHFEGEPASPDATAARRAIEFLLLDIPDLKAVVLVRDQDNEPERRVGLEQARDADRSGVPIVLGLAVPERECWVLCGFDPQDDAETSRLEITRQSLGFDPRIRSHELTAGSDDRATRSPKRVLRELTVNDRDRQHLCWRDTPLAQLRQRGTENGLQDYLNEVRDRLATLIGHVSRDQFDSSPN